MNMAQIKYFITAAKCLNFTKVADKLFITQPALSRQISAMEKELNIGILEGAYVGDLFPLDSRNSLYKNTTVRLWMKSAIQA